jgi:membrane-bound lytic murein transglycosylase F
MVFLAWIFLWFEEKSPLEEDEFTNETESINIDLDSIKKRGKLIALTRYNANSFFIYRGQLMGYEYELLKLFTKEIGVDLEIKIPSTRDSLYQMLESGEGDLIAANLAVTKETSENILFSEHHNTMRQVLVQKLPANFRFMNSRQKKESLVQDPIDLIGKTITVPANGAFHHRLLNLSKEIGGDIIINATEKYETEDLIAMVSRGEIEFTIAYENSAELDKSFYKNIDVSVPISFAQRVAWGFRHTSPELKTAADEWITKLKRNANPTYNIIFNKYYRNSSLYNSRRNSEYYVLETGAISPYDALFKKYEKPPLIPWTLLASMAYQESRFDHSVESWAGAKGLMQVLPTTAASMGIEDISTPANNLRASVRFLEYVYKNYWKDMTDTTEIIKFMLASYNAGPGHIQDAQRIAAIDGGDSLKWEGNVADAVRKLSNPEYYYRPEVKYGYCRGDEPYFYVKEIMDRKRMYDGILEAMTARKTTDTTTQK